jgi:anti-sigma-K factor RskA
VVTDQASGHGPFEELAAGYALDALEPADEQRFLRHAQRCPACTQALVDYREVAAALADTAPPAEPRPQLADRIMAAALADLGVGPQRSASPADAGRENWAAAGPGDADTAPGDPVTMPGDHVTGQGEAITARTDAVTAREDAVAAREDAVTAREDAHVMAADAGTAQEDVLPPGVVRLRPRASRWLRPAAAAAAVALIAGGGTWAGLAATSSPTREPPSASCAHEHGCSQVVLTGAATHQVAAKVLVQAGVAWMVPTNMKADDTADQIYVLWQLTGNSRPLAVGSFDVRAGTDTPIWIGDLAAPYAGTLAFAVSLEHGRTVPASPSRIVALGQVS